MSVLGAALALLVSSPSVRASFDRAYLPGGAGDSAPVVHLAARGAKEVEVSLYEVGHPVETLLGLTSVPESHGRSVPVEGTLEAVPLAASIGALQHRAREGYAALWRSLRAPARDVVKELFGLGRPLGASLLAQQTAPESRIRRGEKLLRSWRLPMGEEGWNYTDLDLGSVHSGLFRVQVLAATASAEAILTVSRLSLLAVRTGEGSSILATDAVDGRPLPGVELLSRPPPSDKGGDKVRATALGRTGPGGLWSTRAPLEGEVVGRLDDQLAGVVLQPSFSEPAERVAAAVFFDRRAYRPGEEVRVWCLLRSREGGSWKIPEAEEAELQLVDRRGTILLAEPADVSPLGVVTRDVELPSGLLPGWYSIAVAWGGERRAGELLVQRQAPAEIAARWEAPDWSPPSSPLDVAVIVTDRLGKPERGVEVHWTAEARGAGVSEDVSAGPSEVIGEGVGVSREDGRVPIRLPPAQGEGVVALHAEAEDSAGRTAIVERELRRIQAPAMLDLTPEHRVLRPGRAPSVALEAHALDGQPWHGPVDVHVVGVHNSPSGEAVRSEVLQKVVELDPRGRAEVALPPASPGYLEVRASLPGSGESLARASIFVTENGGDIPTTPDRLEVVLDRNDYGRGDDVRALVLTPFESGTVLLGLEPSGGPPDELVAVHGYSGVAHLKLASSAFAARLSAASLVGGTLYRASVSVPLPERTPSLALHLTPERPLHGGQRGVLVVGALDAEGRGVPATLEVSASTSPPAAPSLAQLFLPGTPAAAALFSSSGAEDSAGGVEGRTPAPRVLQPFGPSHLGQVAWEREDATAQTATISADDSGHGALALHVPADAERLYVTARGVGGSDLFGERTWILPVVPTPGLAVEAPRWVRAGDQFETHATARAADASGCALTLDVLGGALERSSCADGTGRVGRVAAGPGPELELTAALPSAKLSAHRTVRVAGPGLAPATAGDLARAVAEGLAGSSQSTDQIELDCAALRALGALRPVDRNGSEIASALARVAEEENVVGGFGSPDGELRRDLAVLRGLVGLKESGTVVDAGLLSRLQRRLEVLVERVADAEERDLFEGLTQGLVEELDREKPGPRRATRLPRGDPSEVTDEDPGRIANWLAEHRPDAASGEAIAAHLVELVAAAGPLDAAEIAAALAALDRRLPVDLAASPTVSRRYLRIDRQPWTETLLAADGEPAEPTLAAVAGPIVLGAELEVALGSPVDPAVRFACLRDFLPAGLAPMGSPEVSPGGILLCGPTNRERLEVSYQVRAVRTGRFQAPAGGLGVVGQPGPATWVEVTP